MRKRNSDLFAVSVSQRAVDFRRSLHPVKTNRNLCAAILCNRSLNRKVMYEFLRAKHQLNIPENSGKTQLILILQIGSVTPFQNQNRHTVATCFGFAGDFKFAGTVGNLAVTDKFAVDPDIEAGIYALKIQELTFAGFFFCQSKILYISAAGIFTGCIRRVIRDGIADIGVLLLSKALHLPAGGHFHVDKALFFEILFPEMLRYFFHTGIPGKFPVVPAQQDLALPSILFRHIPAAVVHCADMQSGEIFIKILHFHLVVSFLYTLVDTGILFRLSFLQLLTHLENIEFQVVGFLRRPEDRMIRRLCFKFHLTQSLMRSVGCFSDGLCEQLRIHKVGTGAGH